MHPKDLSINDFTYELPDDRIALFPAHPRDSAKLLIFKKGNITESTYANLADFLPDNAALVFNDTRVIKSRILFKKDTGATIEIFCLEPFGKFDDYEDFFLQTGNSTWKCMIGKAGKWKEKRLSKQIGIDNQEVILSAELVEKLEDCYVVQFSWTPSGFSVAAIMNAAGVTPLPPYIKRAANQEDEETYQTVYSEHEGSVAAPTAGLHFTQRIMDSLHNKGIDTLFTTLHVGAGTFKPVKADTMAGHHMHAEWINLTLDFLKKLAVHLDKKIISVGTTSTRTLESIFWMGNKILNQADISYEKLKITQWEVYEPQPQHPASAAVTALIDWMKAQQLNHLLIETEIIIAPGYQFQIVTGLITNFHQPKSTLLLLVAALAGPEWKSIYQYALHHDFRFLSYGDGCLIMP